MKIRQKEFDQAHALKSNGVSNALIAKVLKVSGATISNIVKAKTLDEYHEICKPRVKVASLSGETQPFFKRSDSLRDMTTLQRLNIAIETLEVAKQLLLSCKTKNV